MSEKLRQLGEPLRTGGSFPKFLLIIVSLIAVLILAYYLGKLQEVFRRPIIQDEPFDLYCDLLRRVRLSRFQRRLMRYVVRDLELKNPSAILISESLFDQQVGQWRKHQTRTPSRSRPTPTDSVWQAIRLRLFPKS